MPKIRGRELGTTNWAELGLYWGFPGASDSKESASNARDLDLIPGSGRSLENGMATHSGNFAQRITWTEEPGRIYSMGSERVTLCPLSQTQLSG